MEKLIQEILDKNISNYKELGNEGLYEGLDDVLNLSTLVQEISKMLQELKNEYDDEEEYQETLEMNIDDTCHYQIMNKFFPQLKKNLENLGYKLINDYDWKLPNKGGILTTYGIIWDVWGMGYDTNVRESIAYNFEYYLDNQ